MPDPAGKPEALGNVVRVRRPEVVDSAGWSAIDAAEIARGSDEGRPRSKFTDIAHMLEVAATAPPEPPPNSPPRTEALSPVPPISIARV